MQNLFLVGLLLIAGIASVTAQTTNNQKDELVKLNGKSLTLFQEAKYAEALTVSNRASGGSLNSMF